MQTTGELLWTLWWTFSFCNTPRIASKAEWSLKGLCLVDFNSCAVSTLMNVLMSPPVSIYELCLMFNLILRTYLTCFFPVLCQNHRTIFAARLQDGVLEILTFTHKTVRSLTANGWVWADTTRQGSSNGSDTRISWGKKQSPVGSKSLRGVKFQNCQRQIICNDCSSYFGYLVLFPQSSIPNRKRRFGSYVSILSLQVL
jgi:hypothetical protein